MSTTASRNRSSSVTNALKQIPLNQPVRGDDSGSSTPATSNLEIKPLSSKPRPKYDRDALPELYHSKGFVDDLKTGRWMLIPSSSFILMAVVAFLYAQHELLVRAGYLSKGTINPFVYLLFPTNQQPNGLYSKSWADVLFILHHVIFWSFVRQSVTIYILRPLAKPLGVRGAKIMRFTEQGYTFFYMTVFGIYGIYVMRGLPTWWYRAEHFWLDYPHKEISYDLKRYYLLQASYWLQQTIILAAKIEKPRKDFKELVAHHLVSLWLIGWSYNLHLTYIGVSIFVTMDISDIFLALSKTVNYVNETASVPIFAFFVGIWAYFRHYLNLWILWSVWAQFDLIPPQHRAKFSPMTDEWLAPWMQWQIFAPILLLQFINLFWFFLILRILYRAIFTEKAADERSDDEDEGEDLQTTEDKINHPKGDKAE